MGILRLPPFWRFPTSSHFLSDGIESQYRKPACHVGRCSVPCPAPAGLRDASRRVAKPSAMPSPFRSPRRSWGILERSSGTNAARCQREDWVFEMPMDFNAVASRNRVGHAAPFAFSIPLRISPALRSASRWGRKGPAPFREPARLSTSSPHPGGDAVGVKSLKVASEPPASRRESPRCRGRWGPCRKAHHHD